MRLLIILGIAVFLPSALLAQEISITHFCKVFPPHHEGDANYKPGVDVNGKAVAPADLSQPLKSLEYPIEIPIEVNLIKWLNLNISQGIDLDPQVAHLTLFEDGHLEYNGQDVSNRVNYHCDESVTELSDVPQHPQTQPKAPNSSSGQPAASTVTSGEVTSGQILEGEAH